MDFSDIALAKLLQTQPELGPLVVSFQDMTEEISEDGSVNVGAFILRSGSEMYFIPVIAKADTLYPLDSIFMATKSKFFPLTKKVISQILVSTQSTMGTPAKVPKTVTENPTVYGLVVPPRTGKYAYAGQSRLVDFLAGMPDRVKSYAFEKFAAERTLYDDLDKMFGLKAIFDVLKPAPASAASKTNEVPISVATGATPQLTDEMVQNVLRDGYSVQGTNPHPRVALSVQDYNKDGKTMEVSAADANQDYMLSLRYGPNREAFLAPMHKLNPEGLTLAVFTNGDYAYADRFVTVGDPLNRREVLTRLFDFNPPVLLKDLEQGDKFTIYTVSGKFLGPFTADNITLSNRGVEIKTGYGKDRPLICGYRNFVGEAEQAGCHIYVPSNSVVLRLCDNLTHDLECSVYKAAERNQFETLKFLGAEINLGYDGVEFSMNGSPVGGVPKVMEILVVKEGIDPTQAQNFVKQAQVNKSLKIYLSKQASISGDAQPSEIPSYGQIPSDSPNLRQNGAYNPDLARSVQQTMPLQDSQVTESTIMSELLQVPDMYAQIEEYLPTIEEAIDKLGRILFLTRTHISKMSMSTDAESLLAFLAQIKAVYRMLGDNYLKLQEAVVGARAADSTEAHTNAESQQ